MSDQHIPFDVAFSLSVVGPTVWIDIHLSFFDLTVARITFKGMIRVVGNKMLFPPALSSSIYVEETNGHE